MIENVQLDQFHNHSTALDWIQNKGETITNISTVSLVRSCLPLMKRVTTKSEFTVALMHGLGSALTVSSKEAFFKQVCIYFTKLRNLYIV